MFPCEKGWGDMSGLRVLSEGLADAKKSRVAMVNRVERGATADLLDAPEMIRMVRDLEDDYGKMLVTVYNQVVPAHVRDWAAAIPAIGTGELFPRMLALIGHPRIATPERREGKGTVPDGEPYERTLRQFWQLCGCGDPRSNPRGDILGHSPSQKEKLRGGKRTTVRPLLYSFSSSLALQGQVVTKADSKFFGRPRSQVVADSEFFKLFTEARKEAAGHTHQWQCQNKKLPQFGSNGCGTVMHPEWGEIGSPWRPGHCQSHAHRMVAKEFLRQLWEICGVC